MSEREPELTVEAGGVLRLSPGIVRRLSAPVGTQFHPFVAGENLLVLFRENEVVPEMAEWIATCTMVGRVGAFGVADMFSTLNMGQKTGVLVFEVERQHKRIYFEHGEIVFAVSTAAEHRLGTILAARGLVTDAQLNEILSEKGATVRLGSRLIQKGYLRAKDLYEAVRYQVEEIVYSIFPMQQGIFYFFEGQFLPEDLAQFTLNTQNLLMEGYRRLDEWGVVREKIPHDGVVMLRKDGWKPVFDYPAMEKIYAQVDGRKSVRDLMKASGLGEFDVHRSLYDLIRRGALATSDPRAAGEDKGASLPGLVEAYNKLYVVIAQAMSRGGQAFAPEQFAEFVGGLDERTRKVLEGVRFDVAAGVGSDVATLLKNLDRLAATPAGKGFAKITGLGDLFKRQQLQTALDEVLNYLLFTLKNVLPAAQADAFIQKVRSAHRRLRERP